MTQTAIIRNGVVVNIIEAEPSGAKGLPGDVLVAATGDAAIGGTFANNVFLPVAQPPLKVKPPRFIDPSAIVSRLTSFAPQVKAFVDSDPTAWMFWQRMIGRAKPIDTADPEFPQAWQLLAGVIGKADAERILAEVMLEAKP